MSKVWDIGQKLEASEYYKNACNEVIMESWGIRKGETGAANDLALICKEMTQAYNEITDDQNEYIIEIERFNDEIDKKIEERNEKIKAHENRIQELEIKEATGELTEEEKDELGKENSELFDISTDGNAEVSDLCKNFNSKSEVRQNSFKSKEKIAEDYGNKAVEKGSELAKTHVSGGFFKKLFGSTGKSKKRAGENALNAGNELLDKVKESQDIDKEISKTLKTTTNKK